MNNPNPPRREDPFALQIASNYIKKQGVRVQRWGAEATEPRAWVPGLDELMLTRGWHPNPMVRAIGELANGILSAFGMEPVPVGEEDFGDVPPDAGTIDPTDPRWPLPEGYSLTPAMARVRALRRLGRALQIFNPMEQESGASVHGAVQRGYLAPPQTPGEQAIDLFAEFAPAIIPGGATYHVGARLGTAAAARFLPRAVATTATKGPGMLARLATRRPALIHMAGRASGELLAGVAIGAEEGWRVQDAELETDWGQVGEWALWGAVGGGVFAAGSGVLTTLRMLRMNRAIQAAITQGIIPAEASLPGLRIGDLVSFARADGTLGWRNTVTGRISKAPEPSEIMAWGRQFGEDFAAGAAKAEQVIGQENIAKLANKPASPEGKMVQALEVQYEQTAKNRVRRFAETAPESIQAEIEQWEILAADASKATIKLDALARARALRRAMSEIIEPLPGGVSFEEERALQRLLKVRPREELEGFANDMISQGRKVEGERLLELINDGLPVSQRMSANEAFMAAIEPKTRGLTRNSLVYDPEGNVAKVIQVRYGQAAIQGVNAPEGAAPIVVPTKDLVLIPKPGTYVRLRDGTVVKVGKVKPQDMAFSTVRRGKKPAAVYGFDQIEVVGNARRTARRLEESYRAKRKPKQKQVEAPAKIRAVDEASGEPVVVESVSADEAIVQPVRGGKKKVTDKKNLKRSQRTAKADPSTAPHHRIVAEAAADKASVKVGGQSGKLTGGTRRIKEQLRYEVEFKTRAAKGRPAVVTRKYHAAADIDLAPPEARTSKAVAKARANAAEIKEGDAVTFKGPDGETYTGKVVNDIEVCD